jgi:hypothetical protein
LTVASHGASAYADRMQAAAAARPIAVPEEAPVVKTPLGFL